VHDLSIEVAAPMEIKRWISSREKPGTLEDMARRILACDRRYEDVERRLRNLYMLEAVVRFGGQNKAAEAIGVHRNTVSRALLKVGIKMHDIRKMARHLAACAQSCEGPNGDDCN
jgi:hypothetical protein